jgi:hypothetical protein
VDLNDNVDESPRDAIGVKRHCFMMCAAAESQSASPLDRTMKASSMLPSRRIWNMTSIRISSADARPGQIGREDMLMSWGTSDGGYAFQEGMHPATMTSERTIKSLIVTSFTQ